MGISRRLDELTHLACTSRGEVAGRGLRRRSKGGRSPRSGNGSRRCDVTWRRRGARSRRSRPNANERRSHRARGALRPRAITWTWHFPRPGSFAFATSLNSSFTGVYEHKQCGGAASGTHKIDKEGFSWIILLVALMVTGFLVISSPFWRLGETISRYLDFR